MRTRPILRRPDSLRVLFARHKVHARLRAYSWLADNFPATVTQDRLAQVRAVGDQEPAASQRRGGKEQAMTNEELLSAASAHDARPWWPNSLFIEDGRLFCVVPEGEYERPATIDADTAERLLLGSALMWLLDNGHDVYVKKYRAGECACETGDNRLDGDTGLAAVLAACEAAYKAGGGT